MLNDYSLMTLTEELKKVMREHKDIKDELEDLSPFLAQLKGTDEGFKVPNGYFDTLENNIFARIKAEEEVENWGSVAADNRVDIPPSMNWLNRFKGLFLRPQVGIGIAMILIVGMAVNIFTSSQAATTELASEEVNEYIQENIEQFSQTLIMEIMEDDLANITNTSTIDATEEELEDYIQENLIQDLDEELLEEFL